MTQTYEQVPGQDADVRRPGIVYLYPTYRVDEHGMPTTEVEDGYVGQSTRPPGARDDEHRNGRGGDPALVSPWEDLAVPGSPILLEQGLFTQLELDELELKHIARLQPRYNDRGNEARPDRIRKVEARRHRDARDAARGLMPRQWPAVQAVPVTVPAGDGWVWPLVKTVLCSRWTRRAVAWLASVVFAWHNLGRAATATGVHLGTGVHLVVAAAAGPIVYLTVRAWWVKEVRPRWRLRRRWR